MKKTFCELTVYQTLENLQGSKNSVFQMLEKLWSEFLLYLPENPAKQYEFMRSQALSVPLFSRRVFPCFSRVTQTQVVSFLPFPAHQSGSSFHGVFCVVFFHPFNTFSITRLVKAPFSVTEEASKGIINKMRIFFSLSGKQSRKTKQNNILQQQTT